MKNYGRKIELHHDKCDVQFKKLEKRVYEETHDREANTLLASRSSVST